MWMQAFFLLYPNHEWLPISTVKEVALDQKVVSASWWDKHSSDHMEKDNIKGVWMCRPKRVAPAKQ